MKIAHENFLFEYFLCDAVIGRFADGERTFYALGDVFGLSDKELDDLYALTRRKAVQSIDDYQEYLRYRRIEQLCRMSDKDVGLDEDEKAVVNVKGEAIEKAKNNEFFKDDPTSRYLMMNGLIGAVARGDLIALKVFGFVACEGILFSDTAAGLNALKKGMEWGDTTATLAYIKYAPDDRGYAIRMLNAIVCKTPFEGLTNRINIKYGLAEERKSKELMLLRRAIEAQRANPDAYDPMLARLVYSEVLGLKDKQKMLFSERKDLLSECYDLPLSLKRGDMEFDEEKFAAAVPARENETKKIVAIAKNADLRALDDYRPLCITASSDYLVERYMRAFKAAFENANVEVISASDLVKIDLEPTASNAFLRCIDEYRENVVLLKVDGETDDVALEFVCDIVKSARRKKFLLAIPPVTLDLGNVLPVCFADADGVKKIKDLVEIIDVGRVRKEEKSEFVEDVFNLKCKAYKADLVLSDDAVALLSSLSEERATEVIDDFVKRNRAEASARVIKADDIRPCLDARSDVVSGYGFGGGSNEKL